MERVSGGPDGEVVGGARRHVLHQQLGLDVDGGRLVAHGAHVHAAVVLRHVHDRQVTVVEVVSSRWKLTSVFL